MVLDTKKFQTNQKPEQSPTRTVFYVPGWTPTCLYQLRQKNP